MPSACYSLPRGCSPWRPLLLLSLAVLLVVVLHALRNELIRRQVQFSAEVALSALVADGAAVVASAVLASTGGAPSPSVAEFTRLLSANEKKAWLQTPRYTSRGYQTARLPQRLRKDLAQFHAASRPAPEGEGGSTPHLHGHVFVASMSGHALEPRLAAFLQGRLSDWTGQRELDFVNSYGPRTYTRGSSLSAHGDRPRTHALSAVVFVAAENLSAPWPLQIVANGTAGADLVHEVFLGAGAEVLLYESTQPHGRVTPLAGDSFTAIFFHWRPAGWTEHVDQLLRDS